MRAVEEAAEVSIGRGVGFAVLAIIVTMAGFSFDPVAALKIGAVGFTLIAAILLYKAERALERDPRATEIWIMLPKDRRPPHEVAQKIIGNAARDAHHRFGYWCASGSLALWAADLTLIAMKV